MIKKVIILLGLSVFLIAAQLSDVGSSPSEEGKLHDDSIKTLMSQMVDLQLTVAHLQDLNRSYQDQLDELNEVKDMYGALLEGISKNGADNDNNYDSIAAYEGAITQSFSLVSQMLANEVAATDGAAPTVVYDTVTFTADTTGLDFTLPTSMVDGVNDLDAIKSAWDTANPTRVVNFSGQPGTYVPAAGDVALTGGRRSYSQVEALVTYD